MVLHLGSLEDFTKVIETNDKVLVDFNATWCGPCRVMGRIIEDINDDFDDITFLKVDTDEFPEIAQTFHVSSIPCMFAFKNHQRVLFKEDGEESEYLLGSRGEDAFRDILVDTFSK